MQLASYVEKESYFHNLDPRVKIIWFIVITIVALVFRTLPVMVLVVLSLLGAWLSAKILPEILSLMRKALPLLSIAIVTWMIFGALKPEGGEVLFSLGILQLEKNDILKAITVALYIFITISVFYTVILTTDFSELACGLSKLGLPYTLTFMIALIFQTIPLLSSEITTILNAQRSRGYELDQGGLIEKYRKYASVVFPFVMRAINLGKNISIGLHVYQFGIGKKRMNYKELQLTGNDYIFIALLLIFILTTITVSLRYGGK
ncbi:energy-coupling factor transporter transmembrane component T family protein [Moorella sp. E306M]|uniref:energy-coupling factor transporter transmembrane component T family protein n=1 Tax=Moorella sp. E306M TaxID=2572683 RepID=UPI0010FFB002|nr:energy-coupling factor transporter transmembrane component T [Moorella sp. E306M]GEA18020.1 hypothetical protein E306M_11560 [Moorella sp. E306M]